MAKLSKAENLRQKGDVTGLLRLMRRAADWLDGMEAAEALAKMGNQSGLDYLLECLQDPDGEVRAIAIEMLQGLDDSRGNQALKELSLTSIYEIVEEYPDTWLECGNCGNRIPINAKVCPRCGIQLYADKIRFVTVETTKDTNYSPAIQQNSSFAYPLSVSAIDASPDRPAEVVVVDFNIPFMSLVSLLVKIALASIPALLILGAIFGLIFLLFGGILASLIR